jgi:alcohol dehydrogenase YqhD (iron-dependent ADH family)
VKKFTYNISTKIYFGENSLDNLGAEIQKYSSNILIIYGSSRIENSGLLNQITYQLSQANINFHTFSGIQPNPRLDSVLDAIKIVKKYNIDFILAIGGGSVIDAGKAVSAGAAQKVNPWRFCKREIYVEKTFPIATVLTLSATGSEMNGNSVITNIITKEKLPFGSDLLRPVFSILDPTLTFSVPKDQTAYGVVDIFTHVVEQYFDKYMGADLTNNLSEGIMKTCIKYGRVAIDEPKNNEARANLMWANSLALNGLINYGTSGGDWSTHFIEHELSAEYDIAHGLGLAILLPSWMKFVLNDKTLPRFVRYAQNVWGLNHKDPWTLAKNGIEATEEFFKSLGVPTKLSLINIDDSHFNKISNQATQFGEIGTFRKLNRDNILQILNSSL